MNFFVFTQNQALRSLSGGSPRDFASSANFSPSKSAEEPFFPSTFHGPISLSLLLHSVLEGEKRKVHNSLSLLLSELLQPVSTYGHPGSSNAQHTGQRPFLGSSAKRLYTRISDVPVIPSDDRRTTHSILYKSLPSHLDLRYLYDKGWPASSVHRMKPGSILKSMSHMLHKSYFTPFPQVPTH